MAEKSSIAKFDKAMDSQDSRFEGVEWYTVDDPGFELCGLAWRKPGEPFRRIPLDADVSEAVNYLSWHSAGVMVRFCTDASEIRIHARMEKDDRMDHMACTGVMGFDLYTGSGKDKFYTRTSRFDFRQDEYVVPVFGPDAEKKMREFTLHFPLYAHPALVRIGLTPGAVVQNAPAWKDPRPIVVYGTSIQQGGCASRPGMCHTNILSRMLERPFINLSFSGSAKVEAKMAEIMADIQDPAMLILDYDANAGAGGLRKTLAPFIDILRAKHPDVPILLVSKLPVVSDFAGNSTYIQERWNLTTIHLGELERRRSAGDKNIHFLDGTTLYGPDPSECTVDGVHATDLGFYQISRHMAPVIERILSTTR